MQIQAELRQVQEALQKKDDELRACKAKAEAEKAEAERGYVSTASELEALYERKLAKEGEQFEDLKAEYERVLVRVPSGGDPSHVPLG